MYIICSHMCTSMYICVYVLIINTFQQQRIFPPYISFEVILAPYKKAL